MTATMATNGARSPGVSFEGGSVARPVPSGVRPSRTLLLAALALAFAGCSSTSSPGEQSFITTHGTHATVTVVHEHLATEQVDLYAIPDGYEPPVQADEALSLGSAQLRDPARVKDAQPYLGEFWVDGTSASAIAAWVIVFGPSSMWCTPILGPSPGPGASNTPNASAPPCYFGVVITRTPARSSSRAEMRPAGSQACARSAGVSMSGGAGRPTSTSSTHSGCDAISTRTPTSPWRWPASA